MSLNWLSGAGTGSLLMSLAKMTAQQTNTASIITQILFYQQFSTIFFFPKIILTKILPKNLFKFFAYFLHKNFSTIRYFFYLTFSSPLKYSCKARLQANCLSLAKAPDQPTKCVFLDLFFTFSVVGLVVECKLIIAHVDFS